MFYSTLGQDDCCRKFTIEGVDYNFEKTDSTIATQFKCMDTCLYTKEGSTHHFCFGEGETKVQCAVPAPTTAAPDTTPPPTTTGKISTYTKLHWRNWQTFAHKIYHNSKKCLLLLLNA